MTKAAQKLRERLQPRREPDVPATQAELARRLGVSQQAVSSWLSGGTTPTAENMAAIEDLFGIPMREWVEAAADEPGSSPRATSQEAETSTGTDR